MKIISAVVAAILIFASPARAADLGSLKDDPVVVPVPTWTGCYFGTDGGYKWGRSKFETTPTYNLNNPAGGVRANNAPFDVASRLVTTTDTNGRGSSETGHTDGGLWGGQAGCNYQLRTGMIFGVEVSGTLDWSKDIITQDVVTAAGRVPVTTLTTEIERRCQFRVGPRLGSTIPLLTGQDGMTELAPLLYATGGYAGTCYRTRQSGSNNNFRRNVANPDVSDSDFLSGWFVGGGIDIPTSFLIPNTFIQIEYSHAEYGDMSVHLAGSNDNGKLSNTSDEVRLGFKYRFSSGLKTPE